MTSVTKSGNKGTAAAQVTTLNGMSELGTLNGAHIDGTSVPVEEPSTTPWSKIIFQTYG